MRATGGLERLSLCPYQYELAETYPPTGYSGDAYLGSCVHKALEIFYREQMDTGYVMQPVEVREAYEAYWRRGGPLPPGLIMPDVFWGSKRFPDYTQQESFEDGLEMISLYYPTALAIEPLMVETEIIHDVGGREPIEMHLDLVTKDKKLIDWKTGRRTKSQIEADTSIQLSVYAWGLRRSGVWQPEHEEAELHSITRLKKGKRNPYPYKVNIVRSRRNVINYEWMDEIFIPRVTAMSEHKAYPANPGVHCSYCPVREKCGHWDSVMTGRESLELALRNEEDGEWDDE